MSIIVEIWKFVGVIVLNLVGTLRPLYLKGFLYFVLFFIFSYKSEFIEKSGGSKYKIPR